MNKQMNVLAITITALMVAIAVVIGTTSFIIPVMGTQGIKVTLASPFLQFVAISFGGVYGAIAYGINDVLSYIVKPMGTYWWEITAVSILKGFLIGFLFNKIKKVDGKVFLRASLFIFSIFSICGISAIVLFLLNIPPHETFEAIFSKNVNILYFSVVFITIFSILTVISIIHFMHEGTYVNNFSLYLKIFFVVVFSSAFIGTTLNTFVIIKYTGPDTPFFPLWSIRVLKEVFVCLVSSFVVLLFTNLKSNILKE